MSASIENRLRRFIEDNFLFSDNLDAFDSEASLIEGGVIDSTGVLELVAYIESEFGIRVADADIVPENLDSIASITRYIAGKSALAA